MQYGNLVYFSALKSSFNSQNQNHDYKENSKLHVVNVV